ncbi:hypothetical protein BDR03DRAFT_1005477 [Suillus americanus]|nr:hypothetical protein BDR03DRAFT_1005477 [Suillus americanus]
MNKALAVIFVNSDDTANFLSFLQKLRKYCSDLTISAAVSLTPFRDSNGNPLTDVSAFAKVLDYIAIMDYDVWDSQSWSPAVGPNAPLRRQFPLRPASLSLTVNFTVLSRLRMRRDTSCLFAEANEGQDY